MPEPRVRPSEFSPEALAAKLDGVLRGLSDASGVLAALGRTLRANVPQQREHPSYEVLVDDWSHAYALAQNRRISHPLKQTVLAIARRLDDAGLGRLRLGRRGKKTRFSLPPAELTAWLAALADARPSVSERPTTIPSAHRPSTSPAASEPAPRAPSAERFEPTVDRESIERPRPARGADRRDDDRPRTERRPNAPANDDPKTATVPPERTSDTKPPRGASDAARAPRASTPHDAQSESASAMIAHRFVLRPGLVVQFSLPSDLTATEAKRLARFITALPFDSTD